MKFVKMSNTEAKKNQQLYLVGWYSEKPESVIPLKLGEYGHSRCGGSIHWMITDKSYETDVFCVPYNGEKYLYVYSFYSEEDVEEQPLWKHLQKHFKNCAILGNTIPEYVVLTNNKLDGYDHDKECLIDGNGEIIEDDDIGGSLEFSEINHNDT